MKHILKNIRVLREHKDISQEAIANSLKISQSSYAKLESGRSKLSLERFILIAGYFDVDCVELFKTDFNCYIS